MGHRRVFVGCAIAMTALVAACVPSATTPVATAKADGTNCPITVPFNDGEHIHWWATCAPASSFTFHFPVGFFMSGAMWNPDDDTPYNASNSASAIVCDAGPDVLLATEIEQERGLMTTFFSIVYPVPVDSACTITITLPEPGPLRFQAAMPVEKAPPGSNLRQVLRGGSQHDDLIVPAAPAPVTEG